MAKEILFYSGVYPFSVSEFINQMEQAKDGDVCVRLNTPGGETLTGMGIIAKYNEHPKGKKIKVDGQAMSFGAFMCCFADEVECLDSSQFLFHRSAFADWIEKDPTIFTDDLKAVLTKNNTALRAGMESKLDLGKFRAISGKTLDDMFSLDSRIDIRFTAEEARQIGLVQKVIPLNAAKKIEINALCGSAGMAAFYDVSVTPTVQPSNTKKMITASEFKTQNPEAYASIVAEGAAAEKERTGSWMAWMDTDPEAAAKGIDSGALVTQKVISEMSVKAVNKLAKAKAESENAPDVTPAASAKAPTEEETELAANMEAFAKMCGTVK
jgi:ATP-dependent protease ClpP protease subunit